VTDPLIPIVSVEQFSNLFLEQVLTGVGSPAERPVYGSLGGTLLRPVAFQPGAFGSIIIRFETEPETPTKETPA
jgi:hypothetical protein